MGQGLTLNANAAGSAILNVAGLFNQLLRAFPRNRLARLMARDAVERNTKGFTCWTQFVAMLFCRLACTASWRERCHGPSPCSSKPIQVPCSANKAPNRSTPSYANEHRPAELLEEGKSAAHQLLQQ